MGFDSVYRVLQELFPQVDSRLLKAVSFEHSKDADAAVEVVLTEIIPHLPEQPLTVGSSSNSQTSLSFFEATDADFSAPVNSHTVVEPVDLEPAAISFDHDANSETEVNRGGVSRLLETFGESKSINADNHDQIRLEVGSENVDNETLNAPELDPSSSITLENNDFAVKFVNSEDEAGMSSVLTRSEQVCSTGCLDEVIEDAKNNKKALALAMDLVIDLMKDVESKEKDAEQAKENARRGSSDIVAKVDEVKHALTRAKEANDMHAGEVNAEKAILATELRELQLRLFTLSDERNKSLVILDEMRRDLEIRMAAALEEIAEAEGEKLERERCAREALLYQESEMEKVVEESKKLKLEAEENSKLQEFLMDRGRTIDILQGEIAVKCQDVLMLKENFDKRIPLSQSLFSSRTSSILASSSLSLRSTTKPFEPETETYETPKKSSELDDSYGILDKSSRSDASPIETVNSINGEEKKVDQLKGILIDDGWELFDNGELLVR